MRKKLLSSIKVLLILLIGISGSPQKSYAESCVLASDFGLGGSLYVPANPNQNGGGTTYKTKDPKTGKTVNTKLLRAFPKGQQIAPWVDTGLYTTGIANNSENSSYAKLKGYIQGEWYPWGAETKTECIMLDCAKNISNHAICLDNGKIVDSNPDHAYPCVLKEGQGLYGLIAIDNNGKTLDPNELGNALTLPTAFFRTFHATVKNNEDSSEDQKYFEVNYSQFCKNNDEQKTVCTKDQQSQGLEYVVRGRLYFKILDRYYDDNGGKYLVSLISGVFSNKGFIEEVVELITDTIKEVTASIYTTITRDLKFITICRAMLVLYVAFTGVSFMIGLIKIEKKELIIRLIKVGLIATLLSEYSWDFFNNNLFNLFTEGAASIAQIIVTSTLYYDNNINDPIFLMPEDATPLSIFDLFFKMLISAPIHKKIVAILFYDWKLYFIPAIYICWYFVLLGIFRAVFLYLLSVMQLALLMVSAPIFIIMLLFQWTKNLFDEWIKLMANSVFLMILVISTFALMMSIITEQLQKLLYYQVCWVSVWDVSIAGLDIFDLMFWYPTFSSQANSALTIGHLFAFLIVSLIFNGFLEEVPTIADSLMGSGRPASAASAGAMQSAIQGSFIGQGMNMVKGLNPVGMVLKKAQGIPLVGDVAKMGEKIVQNPNMLKKGMDKIMMPENGGQIGGNEGTNFMPENVGAKLNEGFERGSKKE
ncbi:type IV secretion system protein [Holosporaceae bacterium 'Namur']|nr:type IV secretion system protein [Holosporaceae bacterium 'Namur']